MARDIHGRRRVGARAAGSRTGAVVADIGDHRRRLGWLWLLLLVAVVAAVLLWLALRHRGDSGVAAAPSHSPTQAAVVAPLSPIAAPSTAGLSAATTQPTGSPAPTGSAAPSASPAGSLPAPGSASPVTGIASIGGGAVTAHQIHGAPAGEVGTVLFPAGSASVDTQGRAALAAVAAQLRSTDAMTVTVTGFANELTSPAGNTALARARATAVATTLRADLAGTPTVVQTLTVGQTDPAAAETTAAGRLADARATVTIPGAALIGGNGVPVHPAAGSAALPAEAIGVSLFPDSSAALDPAARAAVAAAAARITAEHPRSVVVTGYTDSVGGAAGALALSRSRAQAVADALRAALGADSPAITVRAVGEQDQIESDATGDGRRLNRRAVITTTD